MPWTTTIDHHTFRPGGWDRVAVLPGTGAAFVVPCARLLVPMKRS